MRPDRYSTSLFADIAQVIRCDDAAAFNRLTFGIAPQRMAAGLRIHASTTWQTLTRALADAVPTVAVMLGANAFSDLAREFIGQHLPRHAALHDWGNDLPSFLAAGGAAPELIAMARLDRAWMASFFAADAEPIGPDRLISLSHAAILQVRLIVHPSLQLVRLAGPWFETWLAHGALPQVEHGSEAGADGCLVVLSRPQARIRATAVTPATFRFLEVLRSGAPLLAACESALSEDDRFDLQARLSAVFADGLIADCPTGGVAA